MSTPYDLPLRRVHRTRLMQLWRSAGWPCRDPVEVDLLAWGLVQLERSGAGHEALRLTEAGLSRLAEARQGNVRAQSRHDRLADRVARELQAAGRVVWRELTLRAPIELADAAHHVDTMATVRLGDDVDEARPVDGHGPASGAISAPPGPHPGMLQAQEPRPSALWGADDLPATAAPRRPDAWRLARMDVFSVRHTSVEAYLQPAVHEIKVSRADLLSDLRHPTKRQAYEALCSQCWYVFPAGLAEPDEIPPEWGIWTVHSVAPGDGTTGLDAGRLELVRPARHQPCRLPFAVWMALARSTPLSPDEDGPQPLLADVDRPAP